MDESALQSRLDAIERRQSLVLWLLVAGYVLAASWVLVDSVDAVTVYHAAIALSALAGLATVVGISRRRQAS